MFVHADQHAEYERRHNPISADLEAVLLAHGVRDYSIFLDSEASELFAVVEIEDEARWNAIAATEACQRWWARMSPIMPSNPDGSPVAKPLREVFHLERPARPPA